MLQVKVTNTREKDGHCLARGGGCRGASFHILLKGNDYKNIKKHNFL